MNISEFYFNKNYEGDLNMKLGFIGTGNMASAIMSGVIKNNIFLANEIIGSDLLASGREKVKEQFGKIGRAHV